MSQLNVSPSSDHFVRDGRTAHRDHPRSNQKRVWHWDSPWTTTGGIQGDYSPRGLYHRYNKHASLNRCIRLGVEIILVNYILCLSKYLFLCEFSCSSCNVDTLDRTIGERRHVVAVELAVKPVDISSAGGSCEFTFSEELREQLSPEMKDAVENGVHSSYLQGNLFLLLQTYPAALFYLRRNWAWNAQFSMPASTRSFARLSFAGCVFTDPECQHGTRNVSCHGIRLCVPLHA